MAIIKLKEMLIQIYQKESGGIKASVTNTDKVSPIEVIRMNKNLDLLLQTYTPTTDFFGMPATNAIALWLVNGFGHQAEIIEYDKPALSDEKENHIH